MISSFAIHEELKIQYSGIYILKLLAKDKYKIAHPLEDDKKLLVPILRWLLARKYIVLTAESYYTFTTIGLNILDVFLERYSDFLHNYDIFCGVDLENHEFALSHYDKYTDYNEWNAFLNQEKWDDLRIAIAELKGLDVIEIVFLSFVIDGQFGMNKKGFHKELLTGSIWHEIQMICNNAIRLHSLDGRQLRGGYITQKLLEDILSKGETLKVSLQNQSTNFLQSYAHE